MQKMTPDEIRAAVEEVAGAPEIDLRRVTHGPSQIVPVEVPAPDLGPVTEAEPALHDVLFARPVNCGRGRGQMNSLHPIGTPGHPGDGSQVRIVRRWGVELLAVSWPGEDAVRYVPLSAVNMLECRPPSA